MRYWNDYMVVDAQPIFGNLSPPCSGLGKEHFTCQNLICDLGNSNLKECVIGSVFCQKFTQLGAWCNIIMNFENLMTR